MRIPFVWVLLASILASGCATPQLDVRDAPAHRQGAAPATEGAWVRGPDTPRPEFDFSKAIPDGTGHNHEDRSQHAGSYAMELVGFTDLNSASRPGTLPGGYFELALADHYAFISNMGPDRGFSIADIADPAHPRHVSDFYPSDFVPGVELGGGSYWDVSVFPDGNLVLLSAQALVGPSTGPDPRASTGQPDEGGGVFVVNTEDKTHPTMESFFALNDNDALIKVGVHNTNAFQVDDQWYVAATTANGKTYIFELLGQKPHRFLKQISTLTGMHDTAFQVHPITHQPLIYTATNGVYIWDMTDPAHPKQVSFLPNGPKLQSYHETIPADTLIDGKLYAVAGGESLEGDPTLFTLIDVTDPESPQIAGTWLLPGNLKGPGAFYTFSGHNFDVDHGRLIIGHYHAGVWVVDISNETNVANPFPIGFYQPHNDAPYVARTTKGFDNPSVWRATLYTDGYIYTTDTNSGLYALKFTGPPSPLADAPTFPTNIR